MLSPKKAGNFTSARAAPAATHAAATKEKKVRFIEKRLNKKTKLSGVNLGAIWQANKSFPLKFYCYLCF
jgi:hypothetical protein